MKHQNTKSIGIVLFIVCASVVMGSCNRKNNSEVSKNTQKTRPTLDSSLFKQVLQGTSFKYGYDGTFGRYDIADTAKAYRGKVLVGNARAIKIQHSPTGGPSIIKIEVTHFSVSGETSYIGYLYIQMDSIRRRVIKVEKVNGNTQFILFSRWPFGMSYTTLEVREGDGRPYRIFEGKSKDGKFTKMIQKDYIGVTNMIGLASSIETYSLKTIDIKAPFVTNEVVLYEDNEMGLKYLRGKLVERKWLTYTDGTPILDLKTASIKKMFKHIDGKLSQNRYSGEELYYSGNKLINTLSYEEILDVNDKVYENIMVN